MMRQKGEENMKIGFFPSLHDSSNFLHNSWLLCKKDSQGESFEAQQKGIWHHFPYRGSARDVFAGHGFCL
jgi:hypothetical protein